MCLGDGRLRSRENQPIERCESETQWGPATRCETVRMDPDRIARELAERDARMAAELEKAIQGSDEARIRSEREQIADLAPQALASLERRGWPNPIMVTVIVAGMLRDKRKGFAG